MQSIVKLPECSICTDVIEDPRHLPCGHSYCGPPKTCLDMLQSEDMLICALCKEEHKINISDLKPMYGLREFLKEQKETTQGLPTIVSTTSQDRFSCFVHPNTPVTLWCKVCQETMCANCVEFDKHSEHQFVPFAKNLHSIIIQQAGKFADERLSCIILCNEKIRELEPKLQKNQKLLEQLKTLKNSFESYWAEIEAFINQNETIPKNLILSWFFRGNLKTDIEKICHSFSTDACCSTELVLQKSALTQTVDSLDEHATANGETQTNFPYSDVGTQTHVFKVEQETQINFSKVDVQTQTYVSASESIIAKKHSESSCVETFRSCSASGENMIDSESGSLMFNSHYLNIFKIDMNPVVIEFPFDPHQTMPMKFCRPIIIKNGIIDLEIEKKLEKLQVFFWFFGPDSQTFTLKVLLNTMREFWVWKNEKLILGSREKLTTLKWKQLKIRGPNESAIIRVKMYFN